MYDFPNPDDPTEIIRDWTAHSLAEVERCKGVNVRPLYLSPPKREEKPETFPWVWIDLNAAEIKILKNASNNNAEFADLLIAKFKEKNENCKS